MRPSSAQMYATTPGTVVRPLEMRMSRISSTIFSRFTISGFEKSSRDRMSFSGKMDVELNLPVKMPLLSGSLLMPAK